MKITRISWACQCLLLGAGALSSGCVGLKTEPLTFSLTELRESLAQWIQRSPSKANAADASTQEASLADGREPPFPGVRSVSAGTPAPVAAAKVAVTRKAAAPVHMEGAAAIAALAGVAPYPPVPVPAPGAGFALPVAQAAAVPNPAAPVASTAASVPVQMAQGELPKVPERRFSLTLTNAAPDMLFMALLNETPLSVAVDPAVKGPMSVNLKDVTLREALELVRELQGLEYRVIGRHILVTPAQMQTRLYTVDYPSFNRNGRSDLRVVSGSITGAGGGGGGGAAGASSSNGGGAGSSSGGASSGSGPESSRVTTSNRSDLWGELESTIKLLVGEKDGRNVVVSPQTGSIVVRAMPKEHRAVGDFLEAARLSVQRQVMLEAKVVEVQLRDSERTGINWAAFKLGLSTRASLGTLAPGGNLAAQGSIAGGLINVTPGVNLENLATTAGSILGLAFQTSNFASVLEFLATQGNAQVLSSPRIATMNNQKAVLKVGTDDFFVTNISSTTTAVGNSTATTPNISVQPFFSGISLDVTPLIGSDGFITLHIHPAVSTVTERSKVLNLGTQGTFSLPLASSDVNETDAVVRARDGNIIAIGGLMRQSSAMSDSGIPGAQGTFMHKLLGGQASKMTEKRELVILLKPTIIDPGNDGSEAGRDALARLLDWQHAERKRP